MASEEVEAAAWHTSNRYVSLYIFYYLNLLTIVLVLSKALHDRPRLAAVLPEAAMVILVGLAAGLLHYISDMDFNAHEEAAGDEVQHAIVSFDPVSFFVVLLPPVIFNGGYHIRRDLFFRYISPICLYACVGTTICTITVAILLYFVRGVFPFEVSFLELITFGALVSATDPVSTLSVFSAKLVDPHLFYLVFGESVINDAVGLVIFEALAHLLRSQMAQEGEELSVTKEALQFFFDFTILFVGSLCLGLVFGIVFAFFLKKVDFRHTPMLELCMYLTVIYFPFVIAELLHLSGIVCVLFTAIAAKLYAEPNLSEATASNSDTIIRLVAHLTETIIFLELGMSFVGLIEVGAFHAGFVGLALLACLIGRAMNIYPITFFLNLTAGNSGKKKTKNRPQLSGREGEITTDTESPTNSVDGTQLVPKPIDDSKISMAKANMLWFAGLRGAVSYGLVRTFPETENKNIFIVTTVMIIMVTTFVLGGCTEWALDTLGIPMGVDENEYLQSLKAGRKRSTWLRCLESTAIQSLVIRDFKKRNEPPANAESHSQPETEYHEHVEMVEQSQLANADELRPEGRSSVYDFGQQRSSYVVLYTGHL